MRLGWNALACAAAIGCGGAPRQTPSRNVSGAVSTLYWADDGSRTRSPGYPGSASTLAAVWIPAEGDDHRVPVSVHPFDSTFSVDLVPEGPYFLEFDRRSTQPLSGVAFTTAELYQLTTSTPDLSTVVTARADLQWATPPRPACPLDCGDVPLTPFTLDLTGLAPWVGSPAASGFAGDSLRLIGSQANIYGNVPTTSSPAAGATTYHGTRNWNDMSTVAATGFPDASKGDVEFVYQRSSQPVGSGATQGVAHVTTRFQRIDSLTLHEGVAGSAALTLVDAPRTGTLRANMRNSKWTELLADANPGLKQFAGQVVYVVAVPRSLAFPDQPGLNAGASLINVQSASAADVDYGSISYGQFLDPSWKEARYALYDAAVDVPGPGGPAQYTAYPSMFSAEPMPAEGDVVPVLGPPRAPRIEGRDAFQAQTGVGLRPTLSWSPPRLGTATSYVVRLDWVAGTTTALQSVSLTVYGATSVRIPEGLLAPGAQYAATITAVSAPWDKLDRPPFRSGVPYARADCVTAVFSPASP